MSGCTTLRGCADMGPPSSVRSVRGAKPQAYTRARRDAMTQEILSARLRARPMVVRAIGEFLRHDPKTMRCREVHPESPIDDRGGGTSESRSSGGEVRGGGRARGGGARAAR